MSSPAVAKPRQAIAGHVSAGVRLTAVQLKKEITDSGICHFAIEMAKTGRRQAYNPETKEIELVELSEAAHVDMIKFIVKKVLPDAKEYDSVDDRASIDRWADIIAAVPRLADEVAVTG